MSITFHTNVKISYRESAEHFMKKWTIPLILILASIAFMIVSFYTSPLECSDEEGKCYSTRVSKIIGGDTIKTMEGDLIQFALISSPELDEKGGIESKEYLESICPAGSAITIDEDDKMLKGTSERMIAKVYCKGLNLNGEMIINGYAVVDLQYCNNSEFAQESWASQCKR